MGTLINILILTSLILILYFSYNAAHDDGAVDYNEFFKLGGILLLVAFFIGISIGVTFLIIHSFSWILLKILEAVKDGVFTAKVAAFISLLIINGGGVYMILEQIKEKREGDNDSPDETSTVSSEEGVVAEEDKIIEGEIVVEENDDQLLLAKEISISERLSKVLYEAGIKSVSDLTSISEEELGNVKNIGDKSFTEIKEAMKNSGFSFKKD